MTNPRRTNPEVRKRSEPSDDAVFERARIIKAMSKWLDMDATAKLLGRGLGRRGIIERVALDVGTSVRAVRSALRPGL